MYCEVTPTFPMKTTTTWYKAGTKITSVPSMSFMIKMFPDPAENQCASALATLRSTVVFHGGRSVQIEDFSI